MGHCWPAQIASPTALRREMGRHENINGDREVPTCPFKLEGLSEAQFGFRSGAGYTANIAPAKFT